jgi:hypothetical protein
VRKGCVASVPSIELMKFMMMMTMTMTHLLHRSKLHEIFHLLYYARIITILLLTLRKVICKKLCVYNMSTFLLFFFYFLHEAIYNLFHTVIAWINVCIRYTYEPSKFTSHDTLGTFNTMCKNEIH